MKKKIVLVGASTGGPTLIKKILTSIDRLSHTIIIAQHMREEVLPLFIKELDEASHIDVFSTPHTLDLSKPAVYICSESSVLEKLNNELYFKKDSTNQKFTPDIDKLFLSFVPFIKELDIKVIIMTGMGRDGVDGAKILKDIGATIVAQDEMSSPLYGMPRAAVEEGIVDEIKSFDEIQKLLQG